MPGLRRTMLTVSVILMLSGAVVVIGALSVKGIQAYLAIGGVTPEPPEQILPGFEFTLHRFDDAVALTCGIGSGCIVLGKLLLGAVFASRLKFRTMPAQCPN